MADLSIWIVLGGGLVALVAAYALFRRALRLVLALTLGGTGLWSVTGGEPAGEGHATAVVAESPRPSARPADATQLWVTAERLNRRTCPSTDCGSVGQLVFREVVTVRERRGGWVRVSDSYDARCRAGISAHVESGNAACEARNGIDGGRLAEWVSAEFLSPERPSDAAAGAMVAERLVAGSDDLALHRAVFAATAQRLLAEQRCTEADFRTAGGWLRSTRHAGEPVYFTYCGGASVADRLYLNAATGAVFR